MEQKSQGNWRDNVVKVKNAVDIVNYIESLGFSLKPSGANLYKMNCPFHNEKTPSFTVNENFQSFKCWGCGVGGDVIGFAMQYENLEFREVLQKLADEYGVELSESNDENAVDYSSLKKIMSDSRKFYKAHFNHLSDEHVAKIEIAKRGFSYVEDEMPEGSYFGYAPRGNNLFKYLKKKDWGEKIILQSGLVHEKNGRYFDFFQGRLLFEFTDRVGSTVGYSSRKIFDDDRRPGKYINSSESPLFHKQFVLYNHNTAKKYAGKSEEVFVCEGQFDVEAMKCAGILNVVASSGTAFSKNHMDECLKMSNNGKVIFCFDGDEAGQAAAEKVFVRYPYAHESSFVVVFPEKMDPCDYRLQYGNDGLQKYVREHRFSLIEFMLERIRGEFDSLDDPMDSISYVKKCAPILKSVSNHGLRDRFIRVVSMKSFNPVDVVRNAVEEADYFKFNEQREVRHEDPRNDNNSDRDFHDEDILDDEENSVKSISDNSDVDNSHNSSTYDKNPVTFTSIVDEVRKNKDEPFTYTILRYLHIGIMTPERRVSLAERENILPNKYHSFVEEAARFDTPSLIPENFTDSWFAEFVMNDMYVSQEELMSEEEKQDLFFFLQKEVEKSFVKEFMSKFDRKAMRVLERNASAESVEYTMKKREKELQKVLHHVAEMKKI